MMTISTARCRTCSGLGSFAEAAADSDMRESAECIARGRPRKGKARRGVFKDGQLRYALNSGKLRFPLLQQLIRDAADKWERK